MSVRMNKKIKLSLVMASILSINSGTLLAADGGEGDDLHGLTQKKSMVDQVPTSKLSDRAFEAIIEEMYPATPEQMRSVVDKEKSYSNALYDNKSPEALTDIIQVSTRPGASPVTILVAPYHTTTLNLIDSTGQPWPIAAIMYGNDVDYKIAKVDGHDYLNIIRIDPVRGVGTTNINMSLAGLPTTITVIIKNNTDKYYPSPILQIDKEGPQAKASPIYSLDSVNSDQVLKRIVLGIAPDGFEVLKSSDSNVEAWRHKNSLYIRTSYQPSSPLPRGVHHGPGGYAAYRMNDIPVLVMTTDNGHEKIIMIEGGYK